MVKRKTKNKLIDFTFYSGSICMIIMAIIIHVILYKAFFRIYKSVSNKNHISQPQPVDNIFQSQQIEENFSNNIQNSSEIPTL